MTNLNDALSPFDSSETTVYQAQFMGPNGWVNYRSYGTSAEAVDLFRETRFGDKPVRVVKVTQRLRVEVLQETQRGTM